MPNQTLTLSITSTDTPPAFYTFDIRISTSVFYPTVCLTQGGYKRFDFHKVPYYITKKSDVSNNSVHRKIKHLCF